MDKKENAFLSIVRWIIALPLAIAAYFIGFRVYMWGNHYFVGIPFLNDIFEIVGCGFAAALFVGIGAVLCPKYQKIASIVFATIGCLFGIFCCITAFMSTEISLLVILSSVAHIIGSIAGAFMANEYIEESE